MTRLTRPEVFMWGMFCGALIALIVFLVSGGAILLEQR